MRKNQKKSNQSKPRLTWSGKSASEAGYRAIGTPQDSSIRWPNQLFLADNLKVMDHLITHGMKEKIKLVYIDPPFATGSDLHFAGDALISHNGRKAYSDNWGNSLDGYLQMMYERLMKINELLSKDGSIYIHLDDHVSHYIKIIMDELFGKQNLVNQIIWQRTGAHNDPQAYGRNYDVILFYQKSSSRIWNEPRVDYDAAHLARYFQQDANGRWYRLNNPTGKGYQDVTRDFGKGPVKPPRDRHWSVTQSQVDRWLKENRIVYTSSGYPFIKKYLEEMSGKQVQSIWTDLIPPRVAGELTGYPTQKPEKLLERIVRASSNEGDIVADFFCGSGTTLIVAEKLGRRWLGCDTNAEAIEITEQRLKKMGEIKPFEVIRQVASDK